MCLAAWAFWGALGSSGALWDALVRSGAFRGVPGCSGRSGALWGALGRSGAFWGALGALEKLRVSARALPCSALGDWLDANSGSPKRSPTLIKVKGFGAGSALLCPSP